MRTGEEVLKPVSFEIKHTIKLFLLQNPYWCRCDIVFSLPSSYLSRSVKHSHKHIREVGSPLTSFICLDLNIPVIAAFFTSFYLIICSIYSSCLFLILCLNVVVANIFFKKGLVVNSVIPCILSNLLCNNIFVVSSFLFVRRENVSYSRP